MMEMATTILLLSPPALAGLIIMMFRHSWSQFTAALAGRDLAAPAPLTPPAEINVIYPPRRWALDSATGMAFNSPVEAPLRLAA